MKLTIGSSNSEEKIVFSKLNLKFEVIYRAMKGYKIMI